MSTYKANSLNEAEPRKPGRPKATPKIDLTDFDFTEEDLLAGLSDPLWRLSNLYKIINKQNQIVTFVPNKAQSHLLANMHTRNIVLKSRQLGFSTLIQICALDSCLFQPHFRAVVIAQDELTAQAIFRDKILFAYNNLPDILKTALPIEGQSSKSAISFSNGARCEVRVGARGQTPNFLHLSEFAAVSATNEGKAREVVLGAITAVPMDGLIWVESTASGAGENEFYKMCMQALKLQEAGVKELNNLQFKLFFYPWHDDPTNIIDPKGIVLTKEEIHYFEDLEEEIGKKLTDAQKAWWAMTKNSTYGGDIESMYREQPGSISEPFKVSLEGSYFKEQFRKIRKERRITSCPYDEFYPVSVFFDIGSSDETACWAIQKLRNSYAVINYYAASGETFKHFIDVIFSWGYTLEALWLPHDANQTRQLSSGQNQTPAEMMQALAPGVQIFVVPRTPDKQLSIQQARNVLNLCVFDESNCAEGIKHLEAYRKRWDSRAGCWSKLPLHNEASNAADAFQQFAQSVATGAYSSVSGNSRMFGSDYIEEPSLGF